MNEKLVLIDGNSILNRAFYGIPDLTNSEGIHTNAVYGFLNIMLKILAEEKPQYLTVAFDLKAPTFRHKMFDAYKGTRKPMAPELAEQIPIMKQMLRAMGVRIVELEGYEADDLLGTLAFKAEAAGLEVRLISGDRDMLQLATEKICIRIPKTKRTGTEIEDYFAKDVKEAYGVTPREFIDVKALMGDTADNIPGIPGVGEKTATALITTYGSVENAYEHREEVKPNRAKESLSNHYDLAVMSKKLATIVTDSPVELALPESRLGELFTEEAYVLCKKLEFKNLLSRFENKAVSQPKESPYERALTAEAFEALTMAAGGRKVACTVQEEGLFVVLLVDEATGGVFVPKTEADTVLLREGIRRVCTTALCVVTNEAKRLMKFLTVEEKTCAYEKRILQDVTIMAYLVNPVLGEYPYDYLASEYLGRMVQGKEELVGKKPIQAMDEAAVTYALTEAEVVYQSEHPLRQALQQQEMEELFDTMEMPLCYVLEEMERNGIRVNADSLKEYGEALTGRISQLEEQIYEAAGETFNINSPKQLGTILFEKLQMPHAKKTKTGYSTSAEVLEKLAGEYPMVEDVLEYRQLTKLKSTYADGLANYIGEDGRIHGTFNQTITATGRISSTEPNLQNIPIRMELGRQIRKVFVPREGYVFVDADYSQIELRLLAHLSKDEKLLEAFRSGKDIHASTAAQVFGVPFEEVTPELRRNAKAVNFGIVYGISAFGLSQDLDIPVKEADAYIKSYFATYPSIKGYLDGLIASAKESGYATTLYHRRRPMPELLSKNFMQRSFGERVAMNAPIQGTAADIMKLAMIRVSERLRKEELASKLLVQVHDELLIEAKEEETDTVIQILTEEMGHAAELSVDLLVDAHEGKNWYEAK
ncbi:DNA polymerase I [Lachnospiraceae bacterium XBB1006]|nr:DNA polymerase I [Lachnospiraceae bacterium XBB1006]